MRDIGKFYNIQGEGDNTMEILPVDRCDFKEQMSNPWSSTAISEYFWNQGNIKWLLGASICWFLLDFAFYGVGLGTFGTSNSQVIAEIWSSPDKQSTVSIYDVLWQDSIYYIITISTGSLLGSIIVLNVIDYISRKSLLVLSFVVMTALLVWFGLVCLLLLDQIFGLRTPAASRSCSIFSVS